MSAAPAELWRVLREMAREAETNPAFAAELRAWATGNVAQADQVDAAARDMASALQAVTAVTGWDMGPIEIADLPEWVGGGMIAALERWASHRSRLCSHKPQAARPQPVVIAAWKSNFVACLRCAGRTQPEPGSIEHYTCDGCGKVGEVKVNGRVVTWGPLMYEVGCCEACDWRDGET